MGEIQIDFSTENSFSQNQNTRAVNLAKPVQNTPLSQGSSPVPFSLQSQTKQDNVHISRSAQLIQQNTAPFSAYASADTTANTRSVALQNGTLSLTQSEKDGIISDYPIHYQSKYQSAGKRRSFHICFLWTRQCQQKISRERQNFKISGKHFRRK